MKRILTRSNATYLKIMRGGRRIAIIGEIHACMWMAPGAALVTDVMQDEALGMFDSALNLH
jgi:hypothetical protein